MPLFTFVSGYFCEMSSRTTKEKVKSILLVYICGQIFYYFFNSIILGKSSDFVELLSPQWTLWYLLSLTFWYIIYDFIGDKKKWLIFSTIIALYIGFDKSVGAYVSSSRTFFFLPFFILGTMFKKDYISILKKNSIKLFLSSGIIILILFFISNYVRVESLFEYTYYTAYFEKEFIPLLLRIYHYIGATVLGMTIIILVSNKKTLLSKIGSYSLCMYLCHGAVIKLIHKYQLLPYTNKINTIISEIIIVLITIVISIIYYEMLKPKLINRK